MRGEEVGREEYVGGESDHALVAEATGEQVACARPGRLAVCLCAGRWLPLTEGVRHGALLTETTI